MSERPSPHEELARQGDSLRWMEDDFRDFKNRVDQDIDGDITLLAEDIREDFIRDAEEYLALAGEDGDAELKAFAADGLEKLRSAKVVEINAALAENIEAFFKELDAEAEAAQKRADAAKRFAETIREQFTNTDSIIRQLRDMQPIEVKAILQDARAYLETIGEERDKLKGVARTIIGEAEVLLTKTA